MPNSIRWISFTLVLTLPLLLSFPFCAHAQTPADYPSKPVRVVVSTSSGSGTDSTARLAAQKLSESLKHPFIVDNRAGGGGLIAYGLVAKAPADGYTLLAIPPSFTFTPVLYPEFPYNTLTDFTPISLLTRVPLLILVHPALPAKSVKQLIALARSKPGALNVGVGSTGTFTNLVASAFWHAAGAKVTLVPYKGAGDIMVEVIAGNIQMLFGDVRISLAHVQAGRLRALAVTSAQRSTVLPQLPTVAESGLPGYEVVQWIGWVAPAGTPAPIIGKLNGELAKAMKSPDIVRLMEENGGVTVGSTPDELRKLMQAEAARWKKVIIETGIKAE